MPKCKKLLAFFLAVCLIEATVPHSAVATEADTPVPFPSVSAESAILLEGESGTRIYQKNADTRLPMASTTKIMTALVALELASPQTVITVPACAIGTEGSSVYLVEGEVLTLEQLLYAVLLESANDAAVAVAVGTAGSVEAFSEKMNERARAMGLSDTHFCNPHGLDCEEHYTTAYELARIAQIALQNDQFRAIVSTRKTTIPHAGTDGVRLLVNHNKMLRLYQGCIGVKTGFTKHSGRCLVSAAERDGVMLIAVTLNAPNDWNDHQAMLDYGFSRYTSVTLCEARALQYSLPIVGGTDRYVTLVNPTALARALPVDHGEITCRIETRRFEFASVDAGKQLGIARYFCDTDRDGTQELIAELPLVSAYSVARAGVKKTLWQRICAWFGH